MPPGQRKLRDSCDSCHIAKVKCIKTKTGECLRCTSSGSVCSFSPSDRRGKPRGAKNKCNRVPPAQASGAQTPSGRTVAGPAKSITPPSRAQAPASSAATVAPVSAVVTTPDDAYPSPAYEFDKYFNNAPPPDFAAQEGGWALQTPDDVAGDLNLATSDETLASMVQTEWMSLDGGMMHGSPTLQQHTPRTSVSSSAYLDPSLTSQHSFPMQVHSAQEVSIFEGLPSPPTSRSSACKCYPINLQSLYTLHCQQNTASSGHATPFDVALFINNTAIERCHLMLTCTECVLNPDVEKSSTNMLMLAGAMDDILISYGKTCAAYLDATVQDPLVFSSSSCAGSDSSAMSSSSSTSTPPHLDEPEFITRAHSISSSSTSSSSRTSTQLSLGTYRVEGEDGYHLKLEILKIELRKVERLWVVFRDTCAMQKFEDEQKSVYAALVCYLAKKLQRTGEMLEARKRMVSNSGW